MFKSKIIAVSSMKGGVGKTETALNLAAAIRKKTGKQTVLIDFDVPYGGVAQAIGKNKEVSLTDWVRTNRPITEVSLRSIVMKEENSGIDVIPAIASSRDIEKLNGEVAERILTQLDPFYDFIVVDTGVDNSAFTRTALQRADHLVIVTSPQKVSAANNFQYKEDLVQQGIPPEKMRLFINLVRKKSEVDLEKLAKAFEHNGAPLEACAVAYDEPKVRRLRNNNEIVYLKDKRTSFREAVDEIVNSLGIQIPDMGKEKKGLTRLFSRVVAFK